MHEQSTPARAAVLARSLTFRQKEVSQLIVEGLTNKEIAARLSISEQCVKIHVSNLLRRMGTPNRTRLAVELSGRPG